MEIDSERGHPVGPRRIARLLGGSTDPVFSICVMLTDWEEYTECIASFHARGFDEARCEFLVIDNSATNQADGYVALNEFLQSARGSFVVLCHQDVLLLDAGYHELVACLAELDAVDPAWGLCGNAGHTANGEAILCISHPHGARNIIGAPFPRRVVSLDENFIVVRRVANLALSRDLSGFHHYGADLCTVADILGWNTYVIGFFLRHKSAGTIDSSYEQSRMAIAAKYRRAFMPRWIHVVTQHPYFIAGSARRQAIAHLRQRLKARLRVLARQLRR